MCTFYCTGATSETATGFFPLVIGGTRKLCPNTVIICLIIQASKPEATTICGLSFYSRCYAGNQTKTRMFAEIGKLKVCPRGVGNHHSVWLTRTNEKPVFVLPANGIVTHVHEPIATTGNH